MTLKKIAYQLHLWLGMISGLIVFIVCTTGALWALNIYGWVDSESKNIPVEPQSTSLLMPSQLVDLAKDRLKGQTPNSITYTKGEATTMRIYSDDVNMFLAINPYTGKILKVEDYSEDGEYKYTFWDYMRWGHRALWLPWDVGRPIVNYGTLMFVIVLITGLIIWFPKSRKAAKSRLWFNWNKKTPMKRKLFDLHTVLGFYVCFVLLAIAFTGMVWGLEWWSNGLYKATTGGKDLPEWRSAESDTLRIDTLMTPILAVDRIFEKLLNENANDPRISLNYPDSESVESTVGATVSSDKESYYSSDRYSFDRYSLKEIKIDGPYNGKYSEASFGDKLRRMNYEIHVGTIGGTAGKLLVFFSAIFGASLPLTGVYIFIKKRQKKKRK